MSSPPQPAAGSAALMTTTTMTPASTLLYQGGSLNTQYDSTSYNEVHASLQEYGALRNQYVQMINTALREQNPEKRSAKPASHARRSTATTETTAWHNANDA